MEGASLVRAGLVSVVVVSGLAAQARAVEGWVNGLGDGSARASVWTFPNQPPATPNFNQTQTFPSLTMGPNLPGADPRTAVSFQGEDNWRTVVNLRAAMGDTVDWHSMLPHTTATSTDATGLIDVVASLPLGGEARLFTVTWSASDPGVAMHIGWFENGQQIFQTPIMIGPFQRTDTFLVQSEGPVELVRMQITAAARSIVPAPGTLVAAVAGGLLALRRRRTR